MKTRQVIRDVGRALEVPYPEVDKIAKLVPEKLNITLEQSLEMEPRLRELRDTNPAVEEVLAVAAVLEGLPRHASTHASAVVIADRPLIEYLPLYKGNKGELVTQFDMKGVEKVGLVKFDFLGLRTLTVIDQAVRLIRKSHQADFDIHTIPLDDAATFHLLQAANTAGVFQLESDGMRALMVRLKPTVFEDIIALVALYRPGPMETGMHDDYVRRKHGEAKVEYFLPQMEPILKETYGVILYQEQVMQIAAAVSGFSLAEADLLRRAMGKKDPAVMAAQRDRFVSGAVDLGVPKAKATELFNLIEKFAGYGFNKSHSAAYALVAYQTAYLKAHYPLEFLAAVLNSEINNTTALAKHIMEARDQGIELLPPDINRSDRDFTVEDGKVRYGLSGVKNVGTGGHPGDPGGPGPGPLRELPGFPGAHQSQQGEPQGPGVPDPGRGLRHLAAPALPPHGRAGRGPGKDPEPEAPPGHQADVHVRRPGGVPKTTTTGCRRRSPGRNPSNWPGKRRPWGSTSPATPWTPTAPSSRPGSGSPPPTWPRSPIPRK